MTVYLTGDQKRELARAARIEGRTQADLIREGIELVSSRGRSREPTIPLFASGKPDLAQRADEYLGQMALPHELQALPDGSPMPNVVQAVRRSRIGH